ncbi:hypothetical protein [Streptomyces sp. NPDC015125]|uniref:hypothetical protein n=1 Tax=Streptomyces sp. NPDC015125 TaxID=3364938 RepID=UPI0036FC10AD
MPGTTRVMWHHGYVLSDGTPYPLRHRLSTHARSAPVLNDHVLGLSEQESRSSCAAHELGHAVLWLTRGVHVVGLGIGVGRGGRAECGPPAPQQRLDWAIAVAAGERAQDRWLRETGLWTEDRAAFAELGATSDRAQIFAADPTPRPAFGDGGPDYAELHTLADHALDEHWDAILIAMPALLREGWMTGDRLGAWVRTRNPAPRHCL